jgi:hypothetical protein
MPPNDAESKPWSLLQPATRACVELGFQMFRRLLGALEVQPVHLTVEWFVAPVPNSIGGAPMHQFDHAVVYLGRGKMREIRLPAPDSATAVAEFEPWLCVVRAVVPSDSYLAQVGVSPASCQKKLTMSRCTGFARLVVGRGEFGFLDALG